MDIKERILKLEISQVKRVNFLRLIKYSSLEERHFDHMNSHQLIGYLYSLLIKLSRKYGIPHFYINDCLILRKKYYKYYSNNIHYRNKMNNAYEKLLIATCRQIEYKNSIKGKVESVLEKMK
jgi:hypothetical protein